MEFGQKGGFFWGGGAAGNPEKKPQRKNLRARPENQQQTQPTYDTGPESNLQATLVGGERSH